MITKERLEELIKEGATIYYLDGKNIGLIYLDKNHNIGEVYLMGNIDRFEYWLYYQNYSFIPLYKLYETQKQAEWALNYHATRTEELDLPMWEEIEDEIDIYFSCADKRIGHLWVEKYANIILISVGDEDWQKFNGGANEIDYKEACDLCLKLFKGEEK